MKKITVQEMQYKQVKIETGFADVAQYETIDGKRFISAEDAERYELFLEFCKTDHKEILSRSLPRFYEDWYKAKDDHQLEILKRALKYDDSRSIIFGDGIKVGEWFSYKEEDHCYVFVPMSYLKELYEKLIKNLE